MSSINLLEIQAIAIEIAREAGQETLRFWHNGFTQTTKSSEIDVVTEADQATEKLIVERLSHHFPTHHIIGEEGGGAGMPIEQAEYHWYVDPIDGTTNFANHIPMFAVSLALTDQYMNPLVGVVYNPVYDELFTAVIGHGATRNGEAMHVSEQANLRACVIASGFPYDKYTSPENNLREWGAFMVNTRDLRRMGAASLDCCYVACGRFDGYWEQKLKPWDVLAGMLCITESGGKVTDYQGNSEAGFIANGRLVASNPHIHQDMLNILAT
jgi:myo-inositol-1(or 4)-monophosphatase